MLKIRHLGEESCLLISSDSGTTFLEMKVVYSD